MSVSENQLTRLYNDEIYRLGLRLLELQEKAEDWKLKAIAAGQETEVLKLRIVKARKILQSLNLAKVDVKILDAMDVLEGKREIE